ncbi:glyoxal reductase-like isoform X1 [Palaemon carinicauda]|uniref:glyoxal reductase-like isoform X1 n=1 Tax=Palaemon carinicauda TaxID=392227 RepID=UPI0035B673E2
MADVYTNPEKHVILHNNVKMPILGLGTSHDGGYSHEAVVYALKNCGYRHIDTAKRYGCEKYIAQAIKASGVSSEDVFLTTKCWPTDYGTNTTREAFNGSCQRLGVNTLDLYLLHWPDVPSGVRDKNSLLLDTWRTLELLLDEERVRSIGVSNFLEPHLEVILNECSVVPHVNQCEFHPYNNPKKLRSYCKERNIQFEGYSPLAKGMLLNEPQVLEMGKSYERTPAQVLIRWGIQKKIPTIPKSTKGQRVLENSQGYCPLGNGQILTEPSIQDIAQKHSKSPAQILIRWNLQNRVVCIPKSTKNHRVKENSEVFDFELRTEDMDTLNNMTREIQIMDPSTIQAKIDNPLPDGYKLKLVQIPVEP